MLPIDIWELEKNEYINLIKFLIVKAVANNKKAIKIQTRQLDYTFTADDETMWLNFENELSIELRKICIIPKYKNENNMNYFIIDIDGKLKKIAERFIFDYLE